MPSPAAAPPAVDSAQAAPTAAPAPAPEKPAVRPMIDEDFFGGGGSADLQLNGAGTNGFGASAAAAAPQQFLGMAGIGAVAGAGSMLSLIHI